MILELIYLLFLHFVADFLLQSRKMGERKSTDKRWLLAHLSIQFLVFFVGVFALFIYNTFSFWQPGAALEYIKFGTVLALLFSGANAIVHGIIDWNIWRLYKFFTYRRLLHISRNPVSMTLRPGEENPVLLKILIKDFEYWKDHWFYATIGLDQFLHAATLLLLYGWLA